MLDEQKIYKLVLEHFGNGDPQEYIPEIAEQVTDELPERDGLYNKRLYEKACDIGWQYYERIKSKQ